MATKTVTLNGAEQRVDELGGLNALILNNTDAPLYASAKAGVVPYADGVIEIQSGEAQTLPDSNGTVFLLGSGGRAQLTGIVNFKMPSRRSSGDGVTKAEVNGIVTEKIAEVVADAPEDLDTLKEIADWIDGHEDSAAAMNSEIKANAADISDIQTEQETQNTYISALQIGLSQISNPNLLDNPDFKINQRGESEYSNGGYTVDRWRISPNIMADGTAVTPISSGIKLSNKNGTISSFLQIIENPSIYKGKIVTLSVNITDTNTLGNSCFIQMVDESGTISNIGAIAHKGVGAYFSTVTIPEDINKLNIICYGSDKRVEPDNTSAYTVFEWVKLELGSRATPFVPPNPAEELIKCQRYFNRYDLISNGIYALGCAIPAGFIKVPFTLPTKMRETPSVNVNDISLISFYGGGSKLYGSSIDGVFCQANNIYTLRFAVDGAQLNGVYMLSADGNAHIDFSADL